MEKGVSCPGDVKRKLARTQSKATYRPNKDDQENAEDQNDDLDEGRDIKPKIDQVRTIMSSIPTAQQKEFIKQN